MDFDPDGAERLSGRVLDRTDEGTLVGIEGELEQRSLTDLLSVFAHADVATRFLALGSVFAPVTVLSPLPVLAVLPVSIPALALAFTFALSLTFALSHLALSLSHLALTFPVHIVVTVHRVGRHALVAAGIRVRHRLFVLPGTATSDAKGQDQGDRSQYGPFSEKSSHLRFLRCPEVP